MTLREGPFRAVRDDSGERDGWWVETVGGAKASMCLFLEAALLADLPALRRLLEKLELVQDLRDMAKPKGKRGKR